MLAHLKKICFHKDGKHACQTAFERQHTALKPPATSRSTSVIKHYSGFWFLHQSHIIQVSTITFFIYLVGDKGSLHSYMIKIEGNQMIIQCLYECISQNLSLFVFHKSWFNQTLTQEDNINTAVVIRTKVWTLGKYWAFCVLVPFGGSPNTHSYIENWNFTFINKCTYLIFVKTKQISKV